MARQAVLLAKKFKPDLVLMDIAMPLLNGLQATRQLLKILPRLKVLMLSAHSDDAYVQNATDSGAVGFLLKQTSAHEVCRAIREVHGGKTFFSPSLSRRLEFRGQTSNPRGADKQESRRIEPRCQWKCSNSSRKAKRARKRRASELGISIKTVEKHREHLVEKLNIHDTAGLTRYAISTGVIENSVQLTIV